MTTGVRGFAAVLVLMFGFSAAVQWNDPDPWIWIAMYGAATVVAALYAAGKRAPIPAGIVVAVAGVWAATLAPAWGRTSFGDAFGHMGMVDLAAEEARECLGLALVAGLTALLAWKARPARTGAR
jgi:hypothetical protein